MNFILELTSLCRLFCSMLCSDPKLDSHRFKDILDEVIAAGKISPSNFSFWWLYYVRYLIKLPAKVLEIV